MNLILKKLIIENFKGIKSLDISFDRDTPRVEISGANGTGKSTIYDAYIWLLFDKNASGEKDFSIKPRQGNGEEKHYQTVRVMGEFELDGKILQLEKIYTEVWTKKRGEETQEYGGNTTEYYINAVPKKSGEYKGYISSLISEDKFKMITSAKYFNEGMNWQDRRKLLFEIAGNNTEEDIIYEYSDSSNVNIVSVMQGLSAEDAFKMYQSQIKKVNADLDKLPVRIDEASRMNYYSAETVDEDKIKSEIRDIQEIINNIDRQIVEKRNFQSETDVKIREMSRLKVKISEREFELKNSGMQREIKISRLKNALDSCEANIKKFEVDIGRSIGTIANKETELDGLRKRYTNEAGKIFEIDGNTLKCITCGQDLPEDMKAAGVDTLRRDFEADKSKKLEETHRKADYVKSEIENAKKAIEKNNISIEEQQGEMKRIKTEIATLQNTVSETVDTESDGIIITLSSSEGEQYSGELRKRDASQSRPVNRRYGYDRAVKRRTPAL